MTKNKESMWWEKTVEYAFIRNVLPELSNAFPLDGNAEKAFGDLLVSDGTEFRLIEFKARKGNIQDEKGKWGFTEENYPDNDEYRKPFHELLCWHHGDNITKYPGHIAHWLIYGSPVDLGFTLKAQGYCSESANETPLENREHLRGLTTVKHDEMLAYLNLLEELRGSAGSGDSSLVIVGVAGGATLALTIEAFRHASPGYKDKWQATENVQSNPSSRPRMQ